MTNIEAGGTRKVNVRRKGSNGYIWHIIILLLYLLFVSISEQKKGEPLVAHRPQLRIVTPRGLNEPEEISADALSVRGFEQYRCDDYHLGRTNVD